MVIHIKTLDLNLWLSIIDSNSTCDTLGWLVELAHSIKFDIERHLTLSDSIVKFHIYVKLSINKFEKKL